MKLDTMKRQRRVIASLLTTFFLMQQSMVIPAMATEIGGSNLPGGWLTPGADGAYNIDPTSVNGSTGFRQYDKFNLSAGDIANLIFKYGNKNIDTFVNLVQDQININGIVNSMRDNAFYNGKAVFISPNGMVVGASGVLNVGSLSVMTPNQNDFDKLRNQPNIANLNNIENSYGTGTVKIDGKVFAQDGVDIKAASVAVGQNAGIMTGVNNMAALNSETQANVLFNQLVNTNNITSGSNLVNENGRIVIKAYGNENAGVNIAGNLKNFGSGEVSIDNTGVDGVKIASAGKVSGNGTVTITNTGAAGIDVDGTVKGRGVELNSLNSNIVIGDNSNDDYVTSYGDLNINLENGDLLSSGAYKTHLVTENGGNLNINVQNGSIGNGNVGGACEGDACVGVGPDARDLTKSINTRVSGKIDAQATSDINLASIDTDMRVGQIKSTDGRVILLADSKIKGQTPYSIVNANGNQDQVNVSGKGVSLIASGGIGEADNRLVIEQTDAENYGVDMLAYKGDINVKTLGNATNVCTIISKEGNVDIHFTGNVNIQEVTAAKKIKLVTEGKTLTIENLGTVPNTPVDYYGPNENIAPEQVELKALDINPETRIDPERAQSVVTVINGRVQGDADPNTEEITIVADDIFIDGKHFINDDENKVIVDGKEYVQFTVVDDDTTNPVQGTDDNEVTIGTRPVRPEDVLEIDHEEDERNYYYEDELPLDTDSDSDTDADSDTDTDTDSDTDTDADSDTDTDADSDTDTDTDTDTDADSDTDTDADSDTDTDADSDTDTDADSDTDTDTDTDTDADSDTDTDADTDTDTDADSDTDTDADSDTDTDADSDTDTDADSDTDTDADSDTDTDADSDTDTDADSDTDTDADSDTDTDADSDTDTDADSDTDTDADSDTDTDADSDTDTDTDTDMDMDSDTDTDTDTDTDNDMDSDTDTDDDPSYDRDSGKETYIQRKVLDENIPSIDKRQYMRFDVAGNRNPVELQQNSQIDSLLDISRGGIAVKHHNQLKVGDIVPVQISYGDLDINADVKIVTATDVRAGAEFVNIDRATANKLLYMNILLEEANNISMK